MSNTLYLVVCRFGLMGIFHDKAGAKSEARVLHENPVDGHLPVWVKACTGNERLESVDIGMFPDRTEEGTPGDWILSTSDEYVHAEELGWVLPGKPHEPRR